MVRTTAWTGKRSPPIAISQTKGVALGFTTNLGLDLYSGWNYLAHQLQLQARLRWTYHPGSDLYVVYGVDVDLDSGAERFQSLLVKATYRWP